MSAAASRTPSFGQTAQHLLREQTEEIRRNLPAVIAGSPVALHDVRVAIRRLRTLLKMFRHALANTPAEQLSQRLGRFTDSLSTYRDVDTQWRVLSSAPVRRIMACSPGWNAFLKTHRALQQSSKQQLTALLQGAAACALMDDLHRLVVSDLAVLDRDPDELMRQGVVKALRKSMRRVEERSVMDPSLPPDTAHALRIACRRTRYMAEFFGPHLDASVVALGRRMKSLQDILGDLHDTDVHLQHLAVVRGCPAELPREFRRRRREIADRFRRAWKAFLASRTRQTAGQFLGA